MSFTVGSLFKPRCENLLMSNVGCEDPQRIIPLNTVFSCRNQPFKFNMVNLGSEMMDRSLSSLVLAANISFIESQLVTDIVSRFWSCWTNRGVNNFSIKWHSWIENSFRQENMPPGIKDCLTSTTSLQTTVKLFKLLSFKTSRLWILVQKEQEPDKQNKLSSWWQKEVTIFLKEEQVLYDRESHKQTQRLF